MIAFPTNQRARQRGLQGPLDGVRLLAVAEAASVLRVSKMAVYRMVHSGELPAIRTDRTFHIPEPSVLEMVNVLNEQPDTT